MEPRELGAQEQSTNLSKEHLKHTVLMTEWASRSRPPTGEEVGHVNHGMEEADKEVMILLLLLFLFLLLLLFQHTLLYQVIDVGGRREEVEEVGDLGSVPMEEHDGKWLVPSREINEDNVKRNFDPDKIGASVVPSPMRGIR